MKTANTKIKNLTAALLIASVSMITACSPKASHKYPTELGKPVDSGKNGDVINPETGERKLSIPSFNQVYKAVLEPRCSKCHGEGDEIVDIGDYNQVKALSAKIYNSTMVTRKMPMKSPLTEAQFGLLKLWLDNGLPQKQIDVIVEPTPTPVVVVVVVEPTPVPSPTPVVVVEPTPTPVEEVVTFDSINVNIFDRTCNICHSRPGLAKKYPLTKEGLLASPLKLIVPGKPDESRLLGTVKNGSMPPQNKGFSMLSETEIKMIQVWILNGAKD